MDELNGQDRTSPAERLGSVGAGVGLVILAFISGVLLAFIVGQVGLLLGLPLQSNQTMQVIILLPAQFLGFLIPLFSYLYTENRLGLIRARIPSLKDIGWSVAGIVALLAGVIVLGTLIQQLGVSSASNSSIETAQQNPDIIPFFVAMSILVVGPCEELLFRGGVQGLLRDNFTPLPAVIIASALFGVAHVAALLGDAALGKLVYIAVTFVLGLILGLLYEHTENIVVPMLTHGIYNAIVFGSLTLG